MSVGGMIPESRYAQLLGVRMHSLAVNVSGRKIGVNGHASRLDTLTIWKRNVEKDGTRSMEELVRWSS